MTATYQQPKKPRFYVDAIQYSRAHGGIKTEQNMNHEDNNAPTIEAGDMFHNNGVRVWRTGSTPGWNNEDYAVNIDYHGGVSTHEEKFYKTDFAVKLSRYYPLATINYFAFLGHNLGRAQAIVEPYVSYYDGNGKEEYNGTSNGNLWDNAGVNTAKNIRVNLSDVIPNLDSDSHHFQFVGNYGDGKFAFFDFDETITDDPEPQTETTSDKGRDVGWSYVRFNDNDQDGDTFGQVWNPEGAFDFNRADLALHNAIGFRLYEYDTDYTAYVPHVNAFSCGWTYVLDRMPDLDITMSWEFDGVKKKTGLGGQTLTNINYTEPAPWQFYRQVKNSDNSVNEDYNIYEVGAWYNHNGQPTHNLAGFAGYKGRRIWKLKFSYVDANNLFDNQWTGWSHPMLSWSSTSYDYPGGKKTYDGFGGDGVDNTFFARVINGTLGGQLPFLFQPNHEKNDDIFLCEFTKDGIDFKQVAHNVWSFNLTIREVW